MPARIASLGSGGERVTRTDAWCPRGAGLGARFERLGGRRRRRAGAGRRRLPARGSALRARPVCTVRARPVRAVRRGQRDPLPARRHGTVRSRQHDAVRSSRSSPLPVRDLTRTRGGVRRARCAAAPSGEVGTAADQAEAGGGREAASPAHAAGASPARTAPSVRGADGHRAAPELRGTAPRPRCPRHPRGRGAWCCHRAAAVPIGFTPDSHPGRQGWGARDCFSPWSRPGVWPRPGGRRGGAAPRRLPGGRGAGRARGAAGAHGGVDRCARGVCLRSVRRDYR